MLVSDLGLAFLEKHLTILILPEGGLTLGTIFEAHTEVRQHIVTELVAQHEELFGTLIGPFSNLVPKLLKRLKKWESKRRCFLC